MRPFRVARASLPLALVLLLWQAPASAQWYRDYEDGIRAVQQRQWGTAEAKLAAAKRSPDAPPPGRTVNWRSQIFRPFLPDFYLAVVYRNTGRDQQALVLFRQLEQAGMVRRGDPEYAQLQQEVKLAEAALKAREQAAAVTTTSLPASAAPATAAAGPPGSVPGAATTTASPRALEIEQRLRAALREPDPRLAESLLQELQRVDPGYAGLGSLRALVRARRIAANERRAVRAYLSGRYREAVDLLEDIVGNGGRAPARVLFYLACSRAALAVTTPADRDQLLERARASYEQALAVRGFSADWRYISPVVRRLLDAPAGQRPRS
jgi:tetratricopeptide (TPR) repeat protein